VKRVAIIKVRKQKEQEKAGKEESSTTINSHIRCQIHCQEHLGQKVQVRHWG